MISKLIKYIARTVSSEFHCLQSFFNQEYLRHCTFKAQALTFLIRQAITQCPICLDLGQYSH